MTDVPHWDKMGKWIGGRWYQLVSRKVVKRGKQLEEGTTHATSV